MRAAARRRAFASRTRELRAPFLELHGCDLPCIFLFFLQNEKHAARGRATRSRNKKTRRGIPARAFRRNFGEYAFLEDSRYTSQAG
jgi:hypothetical protein